MTGSPRQHRADGTAQAPATKPVKPARWCAFAGEQDLVLARVKRGTVEYRMHGPDHSDGRSDGPGDGRGTVLVFHGGHMRAQLALGEDVFTEAGFRVLVPSRPGYGRTPLTADFTVAGFADAMARLCRDMGIGQVAAVVGISAGGRTALTMAARHPDLVQRVILQSAVGFLPWPDRLTRLGGRLIFHPRIEAVTWALVRTMIRLAPGPGLRLLTRELSLLPAGQVLARLHPADRALLSDLYASMRSGHGFVADMLPVADCTVDVGQPALLIASRNDRSVPFAHAQSLVAALPRAKLVESHADSHMIWFDPDYRAIAATIRAFLLADHTTTCANVNALI
ncbi:Pimeloyl-ACP methyl ester carboxylesterase [Nonomuraea solani]|uniref:Pimeloyl-ACP methyl ester carboxylesterase n=1 Tax=Nonomuraea solani TaxID=1144553 RepID=A0A1H6DCG0_9ACTN|nr:alpha/beta fold hydrolase [Nonomuraea solani]SEG82503.1 Pimeloyl-ACP methyl ester carboxylesterase [Nonomuraea solani]